MFKVQHIPVETLHYHILLDCIKMNVRDMDLEGNPVTHFAVVIRQVRDKLHIVFGLTVPQEKRTKLAAFSVQMGFCGNSLHSMVFFICGPTKTPALTFAAVSFGKKS